MSSNSAENILKNVIRELDLDWNGDGVKDKVALLKNGPCTQLAIVYYNANGQLISYDISGDLGTGEYGGFRTQIVINRNTIHLKTSQMRNEVVLKFRYDHITGQTMLIGKEVEYYGSGASGPSRVSINYLNKKKIVSNSVFSRKQEKFVSTAAKSINIRTGPVPLADVNVDTIYDDAMP
jgi:hypothetical protein